MSQVPIKWAKGYMFDNCACVIWLDMIIPPWWMAKIIIIIVIRTYTFVIERILLLQSNLVRTCFVSLPHCAFCFWQDIGFAHIPVHFLSKMKYAKINSAVNGNIKKGVMFSTYSALIGESSNGQGKYKTRLKQLLNWCGEDFDGCVSLWLARLLLWFA